MSLIYFDHASTGYPKSQAVASAVFNYLSKSGMTVNRGNYDGAYAIEEVVLETREILADLFNATEPRQVIFTSGVTQSLNSFLKGFLRTGDEIIVTGLEHNAVMRPLRQLERQGITFKRIPSDEAGSPRYVLLESLLSEDTKAVLCTHASNVSGEIIDLERLAAFTKTHELIFAVDSAQTAALYPISVKDLGIDFLGFTGHKTLGGPQGIGGFIISDRLHPIMEPLLTGGTGSVSHTEDVPEFLPDRYEAGTPNIPGIIGLNVSLKELIKTGPQVIRDHELTLASHFIEGIRNRGLTDHLRILGPESMDKRCALVSLDLIDGDASELAFYLEDEYHIYTRVGLHCAPHAHQLLGTGNRGALRFSFGYINTIQEVETCLEAMDHYFKRR